MELSEFRQSAGVLKWITGQLQWTLAADASILLSSVNDLRIDHILQLNALAKQVRNQATQVSTFHPYKCHWSEMCVVQYCDASPSNRPSGHSTGGLLTCLAPPEFRKGAEAQLNVINWRSFKLPRKCRGSNGAESQAFAFAEEAAWLSRLAWAELHGQPIVRWRVDEAVSKIPGCLVSDSRGIYDAANKSESPQKGLRSAKAGTELEQAVDDALRAALALRWAHGGAMLADPLTKASLSAKRTGELFLKREQSGTYRP